MKPEQFDRASFTLQVIMLRFLSPRVSFLFAALVVLVAMPVSQLMSAQLIYENDFDDDPVGIYTADNLDADWKAPTFSNGVKEGEQRVSIVDDDNAFAGRSMAVSYPKGMHRPRDTGAQWKLKFEGREDVTVEYRVKFGDGFDFVRGGKLPGLAGGEANTGGKIPDGSDGFSARMHWRTAGSRGSKLTSDQANMTQYMYHPDADKGDGFNWDDGANVGGNDGANDGVNVGAKDGVNVGAKDKWEKFESGKWYHLKHRIKLNTPGVDEQPGLKDGVVQGWLDGKLVLDRDNVRYRNVDTLKIDVFYFSTFFGGSGEQWNTTSDETVFFDDFKIYVTPTED